MSEPIWRNDPIGWLQASLTYEIVTTHQFTAGSTEFSIVRIQDIEAVIVQNSTLKYAEIYLRPNDNGHLSTLKLLICDAVAQARHLKNDDPYPEGQT